jgi:hypothetical protein
MNATPTKAPGKIWLEEAGTLLKAAARKLSEAKALQVPSGGAGTIDFQIVVLAEEVGDIYARVQDLAERVGLETES